MTTNRKRYARAAPALTSRRRPALFLELAVWEALHDIANREKSSAAELIERIAERPRKNLAAAVERFTVDYFRRRAADRLKLAEAAANEN